MTRVVRFQIYRQYEESRQRANDAMVALLAGSQLAAHTLKLTAGSDRLLPEIFPAVPHIGRFNLRTAAAAEVIDAAGPHLATVTVPYALAIHEDFAMQCIDWIRVTQNMTSQSGARAPVTAATMHEILALMLAGSYGPRAAVDLELFHMYRKIRNCHVHAGGRASAALRRPVGALSPDAWARWLDLTAREPSALIAGDTAEYCLLDVFSIFAVTKELGRGINALLQTGLPRSQWAEVCVDDYRERTSRIPNSDAWGRGLVGFARNNYGALALTAQELFQAAATKGAWTSPSRRPYPASGSAPRPSL